MKILHPWGPGGVRNERPQMEPFSSGMRQRATPKLLMCHCGIGTLSCMHARAVHAWYVQDRDLYVVRQNHFVSCPSPIPRYFYQHSQNIDVSLSN